MTKKELYKVTDILNDVLSNYLRGSESEEVIAKLEESVEYSELIKEDPVSEDLENAALMHFKDVMEYETKTGLKMANITSFKAGAMWQKEQIMKKAFPVEIGRQRSDYKCVLHGNFSNCNTGDKVKLIIIKEE